MKLSRLIAMMSLPMLAFTFVEGSDQPPHESQPKFEYPEKVMAIIDAKCMACHNTEARAEKAKKKLMWDRLQKLGKAELIGSLGEISEVLEERSMPPERYLEKFPDKELTKKETKTLAAWADQLSDDLISE